MAAGCVYDGVRLELGLCSLRCFLPEPALFLLCGVINLSCVGVGIFVRVKMFSFSVFPPTPHVSNKPVYHHCAIRIHL